MAKNRSVIFYFLIIIVFGALMYWITREGEALEAARQSATGETMGPQPDSGTPLSLFQDSFISNLVHPLAILLLQIISIIVVARIFAYIFNKIGQPTVIGEVIAGIFLGPSVLGLFLPDVAGFVFPAPSLPNLQFLSQVGLILFMFVIGMELDLKVLRNQAHDALVISHASIVIPYFLGMGLAYFMYGQYAPEDVSFISFSLFMGIAMSITAFPVLARVIQERDLTKTKLGSIAITCAAADDVTAWCILAAVIAIVKAGTFVSALYTMGLAVIYVLVMVFLLQPFLKKLGNVYSARETINKTIVAISFLVLLVSSFLAEIIGIHALFGAFLAGVIMPPNFNFRRIMTEKIEDVSLVLLLPLFFVFTGLRTQIGLLNEPGLWVMCGVIVCTAVAGKFGGSALAARIVGLSWKDSLSIGALMNTRGLMELIVLNIGYDLGILTPGVFAMLVLMALVTTFMTGPALDSINFFFRDKDQAPAQQETLYNILISFGPPVKGKKLLRLADQLTHKNTVDARITALHLTPSADINPKDAEEYEKESFRLVKHEAESLGIKIRTVYRATNDLNKEIARQAAKLRSDLLLIGASHSVFSDDVTGGKVKSILDETRAHVGVLVDKDFEVADRILVTLQDTNDLFLISFAERFIQNNNARITVYDPGRIVKNNMIFSMAIDKLSQQHKENIVLHENIAMPKEFPNAFNLVIVSYTAWRDLTRTKSSWLNNTPSILILKAGT